MLQLSRGGSHVKVKLLRAGLFLYQFLYFRECPKPRADRGRGGRGGSRGRGGDRGRGRGGGGGGGDMTCYNCQVWLELEVFTCLYTFNR